jgi:hypothetical protein
MPTVRLRNGACGAGVALAVERACDGCALREGTCGSGAVKRACDEYALRKGTCGPGAALHVERSAGADCPAMLAQPAHRRTRCAPLRGATLKQLR